MLGKALPKDVLDELTDEKFLHLKHNSRKTYYKGCRGPLCRKAERDKQRRYYKPTNPYNKRDEELEAIIEWLAQVPKSA